MLKKALLTLAILAALTSAGLYYVNKVLLPVQVKGMIIKAAEDALGRKVTFDSLQYSVLRGFVINDVTVFSRENPEEVFIHLDSASVQVLFPALLQRKLIMPSVRVHALAVRVVRLNANAWNFSDLLAPKVSAPASPGAAKPMAVMITGLSVSNARVKLTDLVGGDGFVEMFEPVNIRGSLDLTGTVHLAGDIKIPSTKGTIAFDLHAGMKKTDIQANIQLENILTDKYRRFIPEGVTIPVTTLNIAKTNATMLYAPGNIAVSGSALLNNISAEPLPGITARGTLSLEKISLTINKDGITAQGTAALQDAALELDNGQKLSGNIKAADARISVKGADISAKADLEVRDLSARMPGVSLKSGLKASGLTFDLKEGAVEISARPSFSQLEITLPQGMSFSGTPSGKIHASIPPAGQGELNYNGAFELKDGMFKGLPAIGAVSNIRGTLALSANKALLKDFTFDILGAPVELNGVLKNFADPTVDIKAAARKVDLAIIEKIIPQIIKDNRLTITGRADVQAIATGPVKTLATKGVKATAVLKNMDITSGKLKQSLTGVNGTFVYTAPILAWKDLSGKYRNKTYTLNGSLEDLEEPLIATTIKADDLSVDAQLKKKGDAIRVETLNASWFDASVSATGKVYLLPGKAPTVDITAAGKMSLRDIQKMMPALAKQVEPLKLAGILKINAHVKGDPADWQHLESTVKIETPALSAMGYSAENITVDATQKDGELRPLEIKAKVYDGDLGMIGSVDLVKEGFPFESTCKLDGTNLELLKKDTPLKNQQLSGTLSVDGEIKGVPSDIKSLDGKATFQIKDGYLWDIEVLSKVLSILSSSFQGGSVVIRDANATFNIKDGKVETNNLTLSSQTVSLIGEGWVDMTDQSVDLNITPRLETPASNGSGTDLVSLINPTQGLVNIHVTGTLSKPKIDHNITAPTIIKKTLQNTVGGLLKLFE